MPHHLTPHEEELARRLREVRGDIRNLEAEASVLRDDLLDSLSGEMMAVTASGDIALQVRHQTRATVDTKKLKALWPEIWEQCHNNNEITVLLTPMPTRRRPVMAGHDFPDLPPEEPLPEPDREEIPMEVPPLPDLRSLP